MVYYFIKCFITHIIVIDWIKDEAFVARYRRTHVKHEEISLIRSKNNNNF